MDRGPWCASQRCRACVVAGAALVIVDEGDEDDFGEAAAGFAWFFDAGFAEAVDDGEDDASGVRRAVVAAALGEVGHDGAGGQHEGSGFGDGAEEVDVGQCGLGDSNG